MQDDCILIDGSLQVVFKKGYNSSRLAYQAAASLADLSGGHCRGDDVEVVVYEDSDAEANGATTVPLRRAATRARSLRWGGSERNESFEGEVLNARIARQIYDLRTKAGLTQSELAERVGATAFVICRLEDADYEGHSLSMLHRIAEAVDKRIEIRFLPKNLGAGEYGREPMVPE